MNSVAEVYTVVLVDLRTNVTHVVAIGSYTPDEAIVDAISQLHDDAHVAPPSDPYDPCNPDFAILGSRRGDQTDIAAQVLGFDDDDVQSVLQQFAFNTVKH